MKVEISGRVAELATGSPIARVSLTRRTRKRARLQRERLQDNKPEPEYIKAVGYVREVDTESSTFELRDRTDSPNAPNLVFAFDEDDLDDVTDALRSTVATAVLMR
jgi:hypothetical protein